MRKVKISTFFVILVVGLLPVPPATAFDTIIGHFWIEFGGPLGEPPVVLQFSASAPFDVPPAECSPGANYSDCATALKLGIMFSVAGVGEGVLFAELESHVPLVPSKGVKNNWVVGSSWTATFVSPS